MGRFLGRYFVACLSGVAAGTGAFYITGDLWIMLSLGLTINFALCAIVGAIQNIDERLGSIDTYTLKGSAATLDRISKGIAGVAERLSETT